MKTYLKESFQLSVSNLTNIVLIFLQHLPKIRVIPSLLTHKQTKTTQQIKGHLKKVLDISSFPVFSNEAIQERNSFTVDEKLKYALLDKTVNEQTSSEAVASPVILKISNKTNGAEFHHRITWVAPSNSFSKDSVNSQPQTRKVGLPSLIQATENEL